MVPNNEVGNDKFRSITTISHFCLISLSSLGVNKIRNDKKIIFLLDSILSQESQFYTFFEKHY